MQVYVLDPLHQYLVELTLTPLQNREAVFPTRQSLGIMKTKLKGAQIGHDLLKRKSEALTK